MSPCEVCAATLWCCHVSPARAALIEDEAISYNRSQARIEDQLEADRMRREWLERNPVNG